MKPRAVAAIALAGVPGIDAAHAHSIAAPGGGGSAWAGLVIGCLALAGWLYARGLATMWRSAGRASAPSRARARAYALGWTVAAFALVSPVDALGEQLFFAHMLQHELLMLLAAPLLVLGRPLGVYAWALPPRWRAGVAGGLATSGIASAFAFATRPAQAWVLQFVVLWGWHAPPLYQAAIRDDAVHALQHACFLVAALAFWRALLDLRGTRAALAALYAFATGLHACVLGALIALSTTIWYPAYGDAAWLFGLTPLEDQQLGGMIMWMPGGAAYLALALAAMASLLTRGEEGRRSRYRDAGRVA